ncbi:MAG: hypothetical protein R2912_01550 [Eubacteriales bacterium]
MHGADFLQPTAEREPAAVQEPGSVADALNIRQDVRGEQHRGLALDRAKNVDDVLSTRGVERGSRLVKQISSFGRWINACAMPSRCFMPREIR